MSSSELDQKPFILPSEMQQKMLDGSKFNLYIIIIIQCLFSFRSSM